MTPPNRRVTITSPIIRGRPVRAIRTATSATRPLLVLATMTALALGLLLASPAAAFVDETSDDEATEEQAPEEAPEGEAAAQEAAEEESTEERPASEGNGFVGDGGQESPPVGGVDAGFGGGAEQAGIGVPHAAAIVMLGLALAAHVATARRVASVRG
jgi:hypothetical protein